MTLNNASARWKRRKEKRYDKQQNNMTDQKPQLYFLLAVLGGTFVLAFFIFRPFLYALILAAVFAVVFQMIYQRIVNYTRGRQGLAALATILIAIILVFIPLTFLGIQIFQEAQQLYSSLAQGGEKNAVVNIFNDLLGIILLSVLGGIGFFGPIGFLLGPLTISLLFALLDIYFALMRKEKSVI